MKCLAISTNDKAHGSVSWAMFFLGMYLGLIAILTMRVWYYDYMGYRPNMAPQIAYFLSPIIFAMLSAIFFPVEHIVRRFLDAERRWLSLALSGAAYASALTLWAFPDHWRIVYIFNPLVARVLVIAGFRFTMRSNGPASGVSE